MDGSYERREIQPAELEKFMNDLPHSEFVGCNITIPHKEQALRYVDEADDTSRRIGSINTVWIENGKRHAMTTDGIGFCANIENTITNFDFDSKTVTVVGAGGSARPVIDEMLRRGAGQITIANRNLERAKDIATLFGKSVTAVALTDVNLALPRSDLLVNTTSIGLAGESSYPADLAKLPDHAIVSDIIYAPLETPLLRVAKARQLRTVTGLGMLLQQAVPGFEKWFGIRPVVTPELYDLVAADLAQATH